MWTENFQMYRLGLVKAEEPEIRLPTSNGSQRKQENHRKTSISALLTTWKPFTVWITTNCGSFLKNWEYQTTLPVSSESSETCMWVKKQKLEPFMEQLTGSKLGKKYDKAVYCYPVYLTSMQSTSCETLVWMNHKLEPRLLEKYQQSQICRWYHSNSRRRRGTNQPLDEGERRGWKSWLKTQYSKTEDHGMWLHHFMANTRGKRGSSDRFYFLGFKITVDGDCSHEIKRPLVLGRKAMTNLESILKSKDITLPTKVCNVKAMVFPGVMYGCESWIIKMVECWRIDAFKLCWRRLLTLKLRRRSNQSNLREINPEYSLEGLMLKLKLQYFGHLMWRVDSLEKTLMLGKIEGQRRRGWKRMRWLDSITDSTDMSLNRHELSLGDREGQGSLACCIP